MPQVTPLLFLSSTTEDLDAHRQAIQRSLVGLDFLYRGMEYFDARSETARNVVLNELARCDVFVGLIAFRYGSIDEISGLSFTELEYQTARTAKIPTMMFVVDQNFPMREGDRESDEQRAKLALFKASVKESLVHKTFTTPDDLAGKVTRSLERWSGEHTQEWKLRLHTPIIPHEDTHIRRMHSTDGHGVSGEIKNLHYSTNRSVLEHMYAAAYRRDLTDDTFRDVVNHLIMGRDEARVRQQLFNLVEDRPDYLPQTILAIGHRALLQDRTVTDEERRCVLRHKDHPESTVRFQVAHALGKMLGKYQLLIRQQPFGGYKACADECRAALEALRDADTEDPSVREKARNVLAESL
jgi:hypothetical protein